MEKDNSSATMSSMMPAGKPSTSFVTETGKTGDFGDMPIQTESLAPLEGTNVDHLTEDFASKGKSDEMGTSDLMPEGKPSSTFINTGAVK